MRCFLSELEGFWKKRFKYETLFLLSSGNMSIITQNPKEKKAVELLAQFLPLVGVTLPYVPKLIDTRVSLIFPLGHYKEGGDLELFCGTYSMQTTFKQLRADEITMAQIEGAVAAEFGLRRIRSKVAESWKTIGDFVSYYVRHASYQTNTAKTNQ